MPAHQEIILTEKQLLFWQGIWYFLGKKGYKIVPNSLANFPKFLDLKEKSFVPDIPGFCVQRINNLPESFEFLKELQQQIKYLVKEDINFEWNYLGKNDEKQQYLDYLEKLFWQNQTNNQLKKLENFQEILENPYKILNYSSIIEIDAKLPFDFFGEKTAIFLESLSKNLENWELTPNLIHNPKGSFQIKIDCDKHFLIQGYIYNQDNKLFQKLEFLPLT